MTTHPCRAMQATGRWGYSSAGRICAGARGTAEPCSQARPGFRKLEGHQGTSWATTCIQPPAGTSSRGGHPDLAFTARRRLTATVVFGRARGSRLHPVIIRDILFACQRTILRPALKGKQAFEHCRAEESVTASSSALERNVARLFHRKAPTFSRIAFSQTSILGGGSWCTLLD